MQTFGRKGGFTKIVFGKDCLTVNGISCKKKNTHNKAGG